MSCEHDWTVRIGVFRNWLRCSKCKTQWPAKGGMITVYLGLSIGNALFARFLMWLWPQMGYLPKNDLLVFLALHIAWGGVVFTCIKVLNVFHYILIILSSKKEKWL